MADHSRRVKGKQPNRRAEVMERAPRMYEDLRSAASTWSGDEATVVVYHSRDRVPHYGVCTLDGGPHRLVPDGSRAQRAVEGALRETHSWYLKHDRLPPDVFVAFDMATEQVWYGKTLEVVHRREVCQNFHARTLKPIKAVAPTSGEPPLLAQRAEVFTPRQSLELAQRVSGSGDRPEEVFLLEEELLRLAVDSLAGADVLNPLPVHVNGIWVFSRPVVMQRPAGSDRHVRAVWFRQGRVMWRIRTYTAGSTMRIKDVGETAGKQPFVPVWDETRPEQKLLAAVWALIGQGGVTEAHPSQRPVIQNDEGLHAPLLSIVRLKAGTEHAHVYGADQSAAPAQRSPWSVRGHWRHQPYRSLGVDENGRVRTRPIWIASYVKGDPALAPSDNKVVVIRP